MADSVNIDGKTIVECPRCKGLETLEHNQGWWCTNCACFAVDPVEQKIEPAGSVINLDTPKIQIQNAPKKPATFFEITFIAIAFLLMGLVLVGLISEEIRKSNNSQTVRSVSRKDDSDSGYAAGSAWAQKNGIVTREYCAGDSESFISGCEDSADAALKDLKAR